MFLLSGPREAALALLSPSFVFHRRIALMDGNQVLRPSVGEMLFRSFVSVFFVRLSRKGDYTAGTWEKREKGGHQPVCTCRQVVRTLLPASAVLACGPFVLLTQEGFTSLCWARVSIERSDFFFVRRLEHRAESERDYHGWAGFLLWQRE